jgi:hypothetical protein
MMKSRSTWNGDGAAAHVKGLAWEGILRATVYFWTECQKAVGIPNPPPYRNSSKPGEPPRKRTGFGQANIIYEADKSILTTRVGVLSNARYMIGLELFRNRPWLKVTLAKCMGTLKALMRPKR